MKTTSDYKLVNIVKEFKDKQFNDKDTVFALLLRLKQSLEFNSNINWINLYQEMSDIYKNFRPFYSSGKYTLENINPDTFPKNAVFVFGSNTKGLHMGGAARFALDNFGAVYGQSIGLQGQSYAIATLDADDNFTSDTEGNISLIKLPTERILSQINDLIQFAIDNPQIEFHVTKIGCGIAGFDIKEIAVLFKGLLIPENVILPREFVDPIYYEEYLYSPAQKSFYYIKNINHVISVKTNSSVSDKGILEAAFPNSIQIIPEDCVSCDKDDFMLASEQVIKDLYSK